MTLFGVLAAALIGAGLQSPQLPPAPQERSQTVAVQEEPVTELDGVDVVGQRDIRERTTEFVNQISAPPRRQGLARWDREVCVGVANMPRAVSQRMIDRVASVAMEVGLRIGEPGCRADILIIATPEPDSLASEMVAADPSGFRPSFSSTDLGSRALERFKQSDAPVRWWQVSLPVSADTGTVAVQLRGDDAPPQISSPSMSRLRSGIRYDLARVVIIIDTHRLGQASFSALSDYVAMVALAQIDLAADVGPYPTVLNLFSDTPSEMGLTDWDLGYLRSLYAAQRNHALPRGQLNQVVDGMIDGR